MQGLIRSARRLARRPAFSLSATTLIGGTLGILLTVGAAASAVLFDALPYPDEDRLVYLYWSRADLDIPDMAFSLVTASELLDRTGAFSAVGVTRAPINVTYEAADGPRHMRAGIVTPEMFDVLGLEPRLGRAFTADEGAVGTDSRALVLGHRAWQGVFGADPGVVGSRIRVNGDVWTVVGVLPEGRSLAPEEPEPIDVWLPMGVAEQVLGHPAFSSAGYRVFRVTARLRPGFEHDGLPAELDALAAAFGQDYPATVGGWRLNADTLRDRVVGRVGDPLWALLVGSVLLVLVALVNLAGLFVQRAEEETGDIATRVALGATAGRIASIQARDALLIGGAAGTLATLIAAAGLAALGTGRLLALPGHVALDFGGRHVAASYLLSVAAALVAVFGASAVLSGKTRSALGSRAHTRASAKTSRLSKLGLGVQVTMTTCLAIAALSAVRSLADLRGLDTGMRPDGLVTAHVDVPVDLLEPDQLARAGRDMIDELNRRPGIRQAFLWSPMVPSDARLFARLVLERMPEGNTEGFVVARFHSVSAGAITRLGLTVVQGRDMRDDDPSSERPVALVSATAARRWWGDERAALGQRLRRTTQEGWSEVIGVVADAAFSGRLGPGSDNFLDVFFLYDQEPRPTAVLFASAQPGIDVRGALADVVRRTLPQVPVYDVRALDARLHEQEQVHRSTAVLIGLYATASLLIAAIGLAGSTLLLVNRKRLEIGIRQALGAARSRVVVEIGVVTLAVIGLGIALGAVCARWALGLVDPEILSVGPADPLSYAAGVVLLLTAGALAVVIPTWTRIRSEPAVLLQETPRG